MENSLVDKERIIKELTEETGKSEKVIRSIVDHSLKYIQKIIYTDPNAVEINLPKLGVLKANYYLTLNMSKDFEVAQKRMEYLRNNDIRKELRKNPLVRVLNRTYEIGRFSTASFYQIVKKIEIKSNEKNRQIFEKN